MSDHLSKYERHSLHQDQSAKYEAGLALLKQAKKRGPNRRQAFLDALDCFRDMLQVAPFDFRPYLGLGYLFYQLHKDEMAEVFFKQVLVLDPHNQEARQVLHIINQRENAHFKTEGLEAFASFYDALESILKEQVGYLENNLAHLKQCFGDQNTHWLIHQRLEYAQVMFYYLKQGLNLVESGFFGQDIKQNIQHLETLLHQYEIMYHDSELALLLRESLVRDSLKLKRDLEKYQQRPRTPKAEKLQQYQRKGKEHHRDLVDLSQRGYPLTRLRSQYDHYQGLLDKFETLYK